MFYFPYYFHDSDMFTTRVWARTILDQGWINPDPYHPYSGWMKEAGSFDQWKEWWGGLQVYQQSPLYAYLFAGFLWFSDDLIYLHVFQALCAVLLFVLIGRITVYLTGNQWAGLAAFAIAAAYAPFYAYSWALLRDLVSWLITASLIVLLCELDSRLKTPRRVFGLMFAIGLCLGVGLLAREVYSLLIVLVWGATLWWLHRYQKIKAWPAIALGTIVALTPLIIRNITVKAPPLSTSNRFAEGFILGNSASSHPYVFEIPSDMGPILKASGGKAWPVVTGTLSTHPSVVNWLTFQGSKFLSLMDPFETPDNVSFPFMERFSPLVKWGLKHWMIITPGLLGLALGFLRGDTRHWPLWVILPPLLGAIVVALPLSRYRQALAVLWIPWAVYFAFCLLQYARQRNTIRVAVLAVCLVSGWSLSLGPLSRCSAEELDRSLEYALAEGIYQKANQVEEAESMRRILREKRK